MAGVPLPGGNPGVGGLDLVPGDPPGELLLLPNPEGGVLNHGGQNLQGAEPQNKRSEDKLIFKNPLSLEDLCVTSYLKYLETEIVTYISLTQSKSQLVKGVAKKMLQILKTDINSKVTGIASSSVREKMVTNILSDNYPSVQHCNMYLTEDKDESTDSVDEDEMVVPACPNICCTGAFVQEGMMGVVMCAEVRQLIFTADKVRSRRHFPGTLEFNVPVVLTHLLGATEGKVSQLERLVFSENFVKEEAETDPIDNNKKILPRLDQSDKQQIFAKSFGMGNFYDTADRRGIAVDLLILFRDIHPKGLQYNKLTELVLKNNIQCKLYSRANFQFEFLARIGSCCPRLRVFDVSETDTWADCLIALFFKDSFHSLHRYLYFMENEEDECSEYHPHDTNRYCQFCLDQWHPNYVERPHTNNPVTPLLDSVYDHVIKRYPKKSYCILRNCVRVSDLIHSTKSTVFELVRPMRSPICTTCNFTTKSSEADPHNSDSNIKTRLRTHRHSRETSPGAFSSVPSTSACQKVLQKLKEPSSGPGSGEPRPECRRSSRLSPSAAGPSSFQKPAVDGFKEPEQLDRLSCANGTPEKGSSLAGRRSTSKSRELLSLIDPDQADTSGADNGVRTRSMKRKLGVPGEEGSDKVFTRSMKRMLDFSPNYDLGVKKLKTERFSATVGSDRHLRGANSSRSCKGQEAERISLVDGMVVAEESVITQQDWKKLREERDEKFPAIRCKEDELGSLAYCEHHDLWVELEPVQYRQIGLWKHLNQCVNTIEILNIGGSNVVGEFLPFLLLQTPKLKSLGHLNTMIYGLEILKELPGYENYVNHTLQEFSYSSNRSYFCQPYLGFVPETADFKKVRKEMVRYSTKTATKVAHKQRRQILDDVELMVSTCPDLRKVNIVVHYKFAMMDDTHSQVWESLLKLKNLVELDLEALRFDNVRALLSVVGARLERLTVKCDHEQGNGSEIVHLARSCPNISSLKILTGDKILRGEMTLHFNQIFFRKLERLVVEGNVHLHGFAFLWGHCQNLKYMKLGLVVSNELTSTNVLIQDVFTLLFQVNKMVHLEELHIKNLKIRTLAMGTFLLDNLPSLKKASIWYLDISVEDVTAFKKHVKKTEKPRACSRV